jgi:hypothetical protein
VTAASLVIEPLAPERAGDFFAFFEGSAFSDNPRWASCYCQCFLVDHRVVAWKDRGAAENRAQAAALIDSGGMQGYLAYHEGRPVGWCNAAPWRLVTALHEQEEPLAAACAGLAAQGLAVVEAYAKTAATSDAENHHGPLALYEAAGFTPHRSDNEGGVYLRRKLAPAPAPAAEEWADRDAT